MSRSDAFLSPAEAARKLGISAKSLRLYEERGLIAPVRTEAGWRTYGPAEITRASEIAKWRSLGLSLKQAGELLDCDADRLEAILSAHLGRLEGDARRLGATIEEVRKRRAKLAPASSAKSPEVQLVLPWPWGGETFELCSVRPLTYITGPLGCGKTRLAAALAENVPGARFLGLERLDDGGAEARAQLAGDRQLRVRVERALDLLIADGASSSPALLVLLTALAQRGATPLVVDMVEQGLNQATQAALVAHLLAQVAVSAPLILMTRSSTVLDLAAVGPDEAIIHCPANHSPPAVVAPYAGAPGTEAVASCLASPEVRARTAGVVATLPGDAPVADSRLSQ